MTIEKKDYKSSIEKKDYTTKKEKDNCNNDCLNCPVETQELDENVLTQKQKDFMQQYEEKEAKQKKTKKKKVQE